MMRVRKRFFAAILLASGGLACAGPSFEDQIRALKPAIGHYPADFKDKQDEAAVKARYEALKRDLDKALKTHRGDERLLVQRGVLQAMGHNFDHANAWEGATNDLTAALKQDPDDVQAILALATLWVNSRPDLAGKAELLFRAAHCNLGDKPLEEAQRGLFFAFYYQGKFVDAWRQAQYLTHTWPEQKNYATLLDLGRNAAQKQGAAAPQVAMTTCTDKVPSSASRVKP